MNTFSTMGVKKYFRAANHFRCANAKVRPTDAFSRAARCPCGMEFIPRAASVSWKPLCRSSVCSPTTDARREVLPGAGTPSECSPTTDTAYTRPSLPGEPQPPDRGFFQGAKLHHRPPFGRIAEEEKSERSVGNMVKKKSGEKPSCDCRERVFDEFLEDVEKDMKMERYQALWAKHGKWISTVGTVLLGGVVVLAFWQRYEKGKREEAAMAMVRAQNLVAQERSEEALGVFRYLSTQNIKTYPEMAQLAQAALLAEQDFDKNAEEILVLYKDLMHKQTGYTAEIATVLYVQTLLRKSGSTPLDPDQAKEALGLLNLKKKDGKSKTLEGVALLAKEMEGRIYLQQGDLEKARKAFDAITTTKDVPQQMMLRAQLMIQKIQSTEEVLPGSSEPTQETPPSDAKSEKVASEKPKESEGKPVKVKSSKQEKKAKKAEKKAKKEGKRQKKAQKKGDKPKAQKVVKKASSAAQKKDVKS